MAEHLTASELRERLDIERNEFDRLGRAKVWPRARTKQGDRYPWPAALHAYVKERERVARAELPEFIGGSQLADLVNRDKRTLHNWQKLGIPHNAAKRGEQYPLVAAVRWVMEYVAKGSEGENGKELSLAKQKEKEDLLTARNKRMLSDIALAQEMGRVVTIDFMRAEFEVLVAELRDVLANLPSDQADRVVGAVQEAIADMPPAVIDRVTRALGKPKVRALLRGNVDKAMTALRDALTRVAERAVEEPLADDQDGVGDEDLDGEDADDADDAS